MLKSKALTLLNPTTWDDRNDSYFISEYKRIKKAKTVLALCFAASTETYHHWRVFSNGADGVRIEFDREKLVSAFEHHPKIKCGDVDYKKINEIKALEEIKPDRLLFLKRHPYSDEREFRLVHIDEENAADHKSYDIDLGAINHITLSPWMPPALANSVKEMLRSIDGCAGLNIFRSTLVDNETWKSLTARAAE